MSAAENKRIVRRVFDEWFAQHNSAIADEYYVPNYVHHDPALPPQAQHGLEAYKGGVAMFFTAFPDATMTLEDLFAEGDKVVGRWTFAGTHQGELMGMPATGKQVSFSGIEIWRIEEGRVVEGWANFDALGMLQQLGVMPTQPVP